MISGRENCALLKQKLILTMNKLFIINCRGRLTCGITSRVKNAKDSIGAGSRKEIPVRPCVG